MVSLQEVHLPEDPISLSPVCIPVYEILPIADSIHYVLQILDFYINILLESLLCEQVSLAPTVSVMRLSFQTLADLCVAKEYFITNDLKITKVTTAVSVLVCQPQNASTHIYIVL